MSLINWTTSTSPFSSSIINTENVGPIRIAQIVDAAAQKTTNQNYKKK
jgi:hypothetical protein